MAQAVRALHHKRAAWPEPVRPPRASAKQALAELIEEHRREASVAAPPAPSRTGAAFADVVARHRNGALDVSFRTVGAQGCTVAVVWVCAASPCMLPPPPLLRVQAADVVGAARRATSGEVVALGHSASGVSFETVAVRASTAAGAHHSVRLPSSSNTAAIAGWVVLSAYGSTHTVPVTHQVPVVALWHLTNEVSSSGRTASCFSVAASGCAKVRWAACLTEDDAREAAEVRVDRGGFSTFASGTQPVSRSVPVPLRVESSRRQWWIAIRGAHHDGRPAGDAMVYRVTPTSARLGTTFLASADLPAQEDSSPCSPQSLGSPLSPRTEHTERSVPQTADTDSLNAPASTRDSRVAVCGTVRGLPRWFQRSAATPNLVAGLKRSTAAEGRQLTTELVRGLRRLFHRHLTVDWAGVERLRPCDVTREHALKVAAYGTRSFLRFADTYGEVVTLVNQHTVARESPGASTLTLREPLPRARRGPRPLSPLKGDELVEVLTSLCAAEGPWLLPWHAFLLLGTFSADQLHQYLKPLRAAHDKWIATHGVPVKESEFYGLLRSLNAGDYLPLDSLWKVFFRGADEGMGPSFVSCILALYSRTQQIPVLGQCSEVHPNIHLKAYNRAVKKKMKVALLLLHTTTRFLLSRYFGGLVAHAIQRRSRREAIARLCIDVQRRNGAVLLRRHWDALLSHHQWCVHYHDRVQKSKQLMWRTQNATWRRYFEKLQRHSRLRRKRKIIGLKLEKMRIVGERRLARSLTVHRTYYGKWAAFLIRRHQAYLMQHLLRSVRINLLSCSYQRWCDWSWRRVLAKRDRKAAALALRTEDHGRRWRFHVWSLWLQTRRASRIQSAFRNHRDRRLRLEQHRRDVFIEDREAIAQEMNCAAKRVQRWWQWWRPGPGRLIWKWQVQRDALEQERGFAVGMIQSVWRQALATCVVDNVRTEGEEEALAEEDAALDQERALASTAIQRMWRAQETFTRLRALRDIAWAAIGPLEQSAGLVVSTALRRRAACLQTRKARRLRSIRMRCRVAFESLSAMRIQRWWRAGRRLTSAAFEALRTVLPNPPPVWFRVLCTAGGFSRRRRTGRANVDAWAGSSEAIVDAIHNDIVQGMAVAALRNRGGSMSYDEQ